VGGTTTHGRNVTGFIWHCGAVNEGAKSGRGVAANQSWESAGLGCFRQGSARHWPGLPVEVAESKPSRCVDGVFRKMTRCLAPCVKLLGERGGAAHEESVVAGVVSWRRHQHSPPCKNPLWRHACPYQAIFCTEVHPSVNLFKAQIRTELPILLCSQWRTSFILLRCCQSRHI
jgi:hypothetical protein